jgi:hypothetical protein
MHGDFVIRIKVLENGFTVEVPDVEMMKQKQAEAKKNKGMGMPYMGDCTETYAARTVPEVMKMVKGALAKLPEIAYAEAFDEAAKEMKASKG